MQVEPELVDVLADGSSDSDREPRAGERHADSQHPRRRRHRRAAADADGEGKPYKGKTGAHRPRSGARSGRAHGTFPKRRRLERRSLHADNRWRQSAIRPARRDDRRRADSSGRNQSLVARRCAAGGHRCRKFAPQFGELWRRASESAGSAIAQQRSEHRQRLWATTAKYDWFRRSIVANVLTNFVGAAHFGREIGIIGEPMAGASAAGITAVDGSDSPGQRAIGPRDRSRFLEQHPARIGPTAIGDAAAGERCARGEQYVTTIVRRSLVPAAAGRGRSQPAGPTCDGEQFRRRSGLVVDLGHEFLTQRGTQRRCGCWTRPGAAAAPHECGSSDGCHESDLQHDADGRSIRSVGRSSSGPAGREQWGRCVGQFWSAPKQQF